MVDVYLANKNLTVLGGPAKIDLDLSIGGNGRRGSLFFSGFENPNTLSQDDFPERPLAFDMYVLSNPASENYLKVFQYVNQDGQLIWVSVFSLDKSQYSLNKVAKFEDGIALVEVSLDEIGLENISLATLSRSFAYFSVQATLGNYDLENSLDNGTANPVEFFPSAISAQVMNVVFDNENSQPGSSLEFPLKLPIRIKGVEFDGTDWSLIDNKDLLVSLSIDFVNPNEIFAYSPEEETEPEPEPEPETLTVTSSETSAYVINGESNPTLNLVRGQSYIFDINASGHPFWIQTISAPYSSADAYNDGVTGNGTQTGTLSWTVDESAPETLYYVCQFHSAMTGTINITNEGGS